MIQASSFGLIEEGAAFQKLSSRGGPRERFDVVVIGGGQAGLSVGYHLARRGVSFVILDASDRVGGAWRSRWDSLRLFTPARFDSLDGMPFPAAPDHFPTKDEMADYLEAYAARFSLPVRSGTRVRRVSRDGDTYLVDTGDSVIEAAHVVVAMASYQKPKIPVLAKDLDPRIRQVHSSEYRGPSDLRDGAVLIVGAGNSGAEIAMDISRAGKRPISLAGRSPGEVPFRIATFFGVFVLAPLLFRIVFHRLLTVRTPMGRKARRNVHASGAPLIRTKSADLARAGAERTGRVVRVADGKPVLDDGRTLDVTSIVWCTGFASGSSFVDLPVFGEDGRPVHDAGVVSSEPGLYFVGLTFLYAMSSSMIHGVGRDANRIASVVAERLLRRPRAETALSRAAALS